jgi:nucleotide-binding universal stress UspA family protein
MYQKILLTTDGSELARSALEQIEFLAGPQSEVNVVQVVDTVGHIVAQATPAGFEVEGVSRFNVDAAEQVIADQHRAAQQHLDEAKAKLQDAGIANVKTRILEGLPGPSIVEVAEEIECDVIVMATHGRSGVLRAVLGSVADYVIHHAKRVPVLLVRPHAEQSQAATRG